MKCVIIVDNTLSAGLVANTAAVLGLSLGNHIAGLIGPDVTDGSGSLHKGITAVPIPVLCTASEELSRIYRDCRENAANLTVIGFSNVAQNCNSYSDYMIRTQQAQPDDIQYLGLCLYGPRRVVNSLCGQLKLLK